MRPLPCPTLYPTAVLLLVLVAHWLDRRSACWHDRLSYLTSQHGELEQQDDLCNVKSRYHDANDIVAPTLCYDIVILRSLWRYRRSRSYDSSPTLSILYNLFDWMVTRACRIITKLAQSVAHRVCQFRNWKMPVTTYSFHLMHRSSSVRIFVSASTCSVCLVFHCPLVVLQLLSSFQSNLLHLSEFSVNRVCSV